MDSFKLKEILNPSLRYVCIKTIKGDLWVRNLTFDIVSRRAIILECSMEKPHRDFRVNSYISFLNNFGSSHDVIVKNIDIYPPVFMKVSDEFEIENDTLILYSDKYKARNLNKKLKRDKVV